MSNRILHHPFATTDELLDQAASMLSAADMEDAWTSFTCLEVEALAELFRHFGRDSAADRIVASHATGDEPDELHYRQEEPAVFVALDSLAQAAGSTAADAYRAALRTAKERGATDGQIEEAYASGRRRGLNDSLFTSDGRPLPL